MISETICNIMKEIEAIGKNRRNTQQGFQFRGIDDVYNTLHQVCAAHGLFTVPRITSERSEERTTKSGGTLIHRILHIEFDFIDKSGEKLTIGPVIGEAMDSGDKASNKAMSIAHKYALIQVFLIPTAEKKDPDEDSYEPGQRVRQLSRPSAIGTSPMLHQTPQSMINLQEEIESYGLSENRVEAWAIKKWGLNLLALSEEQKATVVALLPKFAETAIKEITDNANASSGSPVN